MITAIPVDTVRRIDHAEALALGAVEHERMVRLLSKVDDEQWTLPTDCDLWDVRALAGHLLGSLDLYSRGFVGSAKAFAKAGRAAKRKGIEPLDEATAAQVAAYAHVPNPEVATTYERLAEPNLRGRAGVPALVRRIPVPIEGRRRPIGDLFGTILTRDVWMHRVDLSRATGLPMELTAEHDGRLIADVVAEWAAAHGQPFSLVLTGPGGGAWRQGDSGARLELDAVEFCRILSSRAAGEGLLATKVTF